MMRQNVNVLLFLAIVSLLCLRTSTPAQEMQEKKLSRIAAERSAVKWDVLLPNAGATLTIAAPDGRIFRKEFRKGESPEFSLVDSKREKLPDGAYTYELRLAPSLSAAAIEKLRAERGKDDESEAERNGRKITLRDPWVESGSFAIVNGQVIVAGAVESQKRNQKSGAQTITPVSGFERTLARFRNHMGARPDDVIPDDLIVQGSACVGLDCVSGESFGFDTVRLKENNTRLQFDDTSTSAGFPTNNWQIRANDSASGGGNFLGIVDQGASGNSEAGTIIGRFDAGAPANSFRVASTGKVGFRTATPVLDLHMNTSDTPAVRFEQNNTGGFTAQTWDIGANEANFFVRDVTGGSRLSFRIRPGAPTSSIDISATGNVGVGTASPSEKLHVSGNTGASYIGFRLDNLATGGRNYGWVNTDNANGIGGGKLSFYDFTTGGATGHRLVIDSSGNIGIGTTSPTQLLSVNGTAGKPGGGTWDVFSDERLKNIKGRYNTGLKALMELQPLRYEYKSDNALGIKLPGEQIGFGAQSVQKIIPEAVSQDSSGYLMVKSDPILWTMLNAIKEQQQEIVALKKEVRKLRASSRMRRR